MAKWASAPAVTGFVPPKKGIVRIYESKGKWLITPLGNGMINVVYTLQVDPGGDSPAWLTNLLATEGPVKSFQNLQKQINKPQYKPGGLAFIKD